MFVNIRLLIYMFQVLKAFEKLGFITLFNSLFTLLKFEIFKSTFNKKKRVNFYLPIHLDFSIFNGNRKILVFMHKVVPKVSFAN